MNCLQKFLNLSIPNVMGHRDMVHLHLLDITLAVQKPTREAVQQLIEQLRGRGKTALTVLLLGADKLHQVLTCPVQNHQTCAFIPHCDCLSVCHVVHMFVQFCVSPYTPSWHRAGKGGVGKSSTVNSLLGERAANVAALQSDVARPQVIARATDGFTLTLIDTPGLLEADAVSDAVRRLQPLRCCLWQLAWGPQARAAGSLHCCLARRAR